MVRSRGSFSGFVFRVCFQGVFSWFVLVVRFHGSFSGFVFVASVTRIVLGVLQIFVGFRSATVVVF